MSALEKRSWRLPAFLGLLFAFASTFITGTGLNEWGKWWDDSFITYRYSDNLARGAGLVWNVGEAPTEGFTSLLHVLLLAPFLMIDGIDPLAVARALGLVFLLGTALLIYRLTSGSSPSAKATAATITVIFISTPSSIQLVMVGLETLPFTFLLLLSVILSARAFTVSRSGRVFPLLLGLVWLVTALMRPEGLLVVLAAWLLVMFRALSKRHAFSTTLMRSTVVLAVGGTAYLLLKLWWFGALLPNPFFLKSSGFAINPLGVASAASFAAMFAGLLALGLSSLTLQVASSLPKMPFQSHVRPPLLHLAAMVSFLFFIFYLRADTLMDIRGRFLFPILPLVLIMATPLLSWILNKLFTLNIRYSALSLMSVFAIILSLANIQVIQIPQAVNVFGYTSVWEREKEELDANVQRKIALELASYAEIESVRIAYGDAGVIPFLTRSLWLDTVGLNDSFLARSNDRAASVDYFFGEKPDLIIQPVTSPGHQTPGEPIDYGHGLLGDYASWADHDGWSQYENIGTFFRTDAPYSLQFWVRSDNPQSKNLGDFLTERLLAPSTL